MSPTVFRAEGMRFFFFSREERRCHVHVFDADGEAKIWLEPDEEVARNHGLSEQRLGRALELVRERRDDISSAWEAYFHS